jgi:hypothetical protein
VDIDPKTRARRVRPVVFAALTALVLGVGGALWSVHTSQNKGPSNVDRGPLTSDEYATALRVARSEVADEGAHVSSVVATLRAGTGACSSGQTLTVTLVGEFPRTRARRAGRSSAGYVGLRGDQSNQRRPL